RLTGPVAEARIAISLEEVVAAHAAELDVIDIRGRDRRNSEHECARDEHQTTHWDPPERRILPGPLSPPSRTLGLSRSRSQDRSFRLHRAVVTSVSNLAAHGAAVWDVRGQWC